MKTFLGSLLLSFLLFTSSALAGATIQSMILTAGQVTSSIDVPPGKKLTVLNFTADGATAAGGKTGTVTAQEVRPGFVYAETVMRSFDPANLNDMPHTIVIAGFPASNPATMEVIFTGAQNVQSFFTYEITNQ